jgi:lipopolysaccharide transport system ATP-binding protein
MCNIAIKVENLSKAYQLGQIGTGTISRDLERWYARIRGKEDPFLRIGESNDQHSKSDSNVVWSLKDINFEIEQGDAVGIIGRNGAGKSTLLKILSKVTAPTTGKISGRGRIASLLEVGTGFHPELSGRENIFLNGAILGMRKKEIQRKLEEIVDFAGIERYLDTPVKRYSSGMYVRLAFAVAAHLESEILIVDEVLAVGDAEFQKKCLGKMSDVSKGEGRTVLFVSHNMDAVLNLCNSGIYLNDGQVELIDNISNTVNGYLRQGSENLLLHINNYNLNNLLSITHFSIDSKSYTKKDIIKFDLTLSSQAVIKVTGLAILLYDEYEKRVAIIDLRHEKLEKNNNHYIKIDGEISNLNLVKNQYSLGLFINSDVYSGDILNLIRMEIIEEPINDFLIYPSNVRGNVIFDYTFKVQ